LFFAPSNVFEEARVIWTPLKMSVKMHSILSCDFCPMEMPTCEPLSLLILLTASLTVIYWLVLLPICLASTDVVSLIGSFYLSLGDIFYSTKCLFLLYSGTLCWTSSSFFFFCFTWNLLLSLIAGLYAIWLLEDFWVSGPAKLSDVISFLGSAFESLVALSEDVLASSGDI